MDLFKLFFEHDLLLDQLSSNEDPRKTNRRESTLEEFLKPSPTYSRFYFTGTTLPEFKFGLNALTEYSGLITSLSTILSSHISILNTVNKDSLQQAIYEAIPGDTILLKPSQKSDTAIPDDIYDTTKSVREKIEVMKPLLNDGFYVLFVEKAHHGFDLHLFSKENIYEPFFHAFKKFLNKDFRFFSINGKRAKSERLFYFETWSLENPPHGFEEVFPETVLR
jgi:hypothetical protein